MATNSSVLAWRIPGTEEPDGLPSMGSHRVGHNWSGLAARRKETLTPATTWRNLEDTMLSELKDKHCGTPLTWSPQLPRSQIQRGQK